MKYVVIRDDDTNALTPIEYLERLYRPFLERGLPVNLAVIPSVRTDVTYGGGIPEGFLVAKNGASETFRPISSNPKLAGYLLDNRGFHIVQHGCHHEFVRGDCEFELHDRRDVLRRLRQGTACLIDAGFPKPETFVAPYDRFTRVSLAETARHFRVISANWYERRRLPVSWWPRYALKKVMRAPHWRVNGTLLLTHPGCSLSCHRPVETILPEIHARLRRQRLTVLVTHWWEFFRDGTPDAPFIDALHATAEDLASARDVTVIAFDDLARGRVAIA